MTSLLYSNISWGTFCILTELSLWMSLSAVCSALKFSSTFLNFSRPPVSETRMFSLRLSTLMITMIMKMIREAFILKRNWIFHNRSDTPTPSPLFGYNYGLKNKEFCIFFLKASLLLIMTKMMSTLRLTSENLSLISSFILPRLSTILASNNNSWVDQNDCLIWKLIDNDKNETLNDYCHDLLYKIKSDLTFHHSLIALISIALQTWFDGFEPS